MSPLLGLAVGMTRAWTATYTTGLPDDVKAGRRAEIDCDLWEQLRLAAFERERPPATAGHVLARATLGIPSDISWRAQAGSAARQERKIQVNDTFAARLVLGVALLVAILPILMGGTIVLDAGVFGASADEDVADSIIFGAVSMLAGAVIVTGLLSRSSPRVGLTVLAIGVISISAFWYWMFIITIPIGAGLLAVAFFRARKGGWPRGTGTA